VTDSELFHLVQQVHRQFKRTSRRKLEVKFHPYRSLRHTIRRTPFLISVRISKRLQHAPPHILKIVAHLLFSRIYKKPVDRQMRRIYREYCNTVYPQISAPVKGYHSQGKHVDLRTRFDYLNRTYFQSQLSVEHIGWSKRSSKRRLGFYDKTRNLLVISRMFDHPRVPPEAIDFLIYHEMLHLKFPTVEKNGRRRIHSEEFKAAERQFPDYRTVDKWIRRFVN
jgi:predicted metal-dependent hydrolase